MARTKVNDPKIVWVPTNLEPCPTCETIEHLAQENCWRIFSIKCQKCGKGYGGVVVSNHVNSPEDKIRVRDSVFNAWQYGVQDEIGKRRRKVKWV